YSISPEYLGHALPDGSYSFTDDLARQQLREQCPSKPVSCKTTTAIFCGKVWGVDPASMLRRARRACRKDPCVGDERLAPCEDLEIAIKQFEAPLLLGK